MRNLRNSSLPVFVYSPESLDESQSQNSRGKEPGVSPIRPVGPPHEDRLPTELIFGRQGTILEPQKLQCVL
jgi:hypothetical protein